jgi:hypothetical protein
VHEILAKIARLAFSKGAAFCYAVTVGVSGQVAYNYLQPHDPAPKTVTAAVPAPNPATPFNAAVVVPIPRAPPPEAAPSPTGLAGAPTGTAKPAPASSSATVPILPPPSSLSLPSPAVLPVPALRPAALPPSRLVVTTPTQPSTAALEPAPKPSVATTANPAPPTETSSHHGAVELAQPAGIADSAVAAPIPLLPSDSAAEIEKAAIQVRPGPGSGGLY